ncbi:hypothetical protein V6N11_056231 [Hibiscus sabdariffa]|uniref:Uncharacterized protein n=1 Tax=Hibiscus sabdariffa TaxID=183260 RepID=A0ABR2T365_9ROSI
MGIVALQHASIINSYTTILETLKIYLFCRRAEEQICRAKVFVLCGSNVSSKNIEDRTLALLAFKSFIHDPGSRMEWTIKIIKSK